MTQSVSPRNLPTGMPGHGTIAMPSPGRDGARDQSGLGSAVRSPQSAIRTLRFLSASGDERERAMPKSGSDQRARRYREKLIPERTKEELERKKDGMTAGRLPPSLIPLDNSELSA